MKVFIISNINSENSEVFIVGDFTTRIGIRARRG
jgi:hypothetical protein